MKDEIDPAFFNDQYWLLFPLHLSWDSSAEVKATGKHKLPLGKGSASRVVVKYPSEGGYTPGDTWELFVRTDNRIQEFRFHRGGSKKPTVVIASWGVCLVTILPASEFNDMGRKSQIESAVKLPPCLNFFGYASGPSVASSALAKA